VAEPEEFQHRLDREDKVECSQRNVEATEPRGEKELLKGWFQR